MKTNDDLVITLNTFSNDFQIPRYKERAALTDSLTHSNGNYCCLITGDENSGQADFTSGVVHNFQNSAKAAFLTSRSQGALTNLVLGLLCAFLLVCGLIFVHTSLSYKYAGFIWPVLLIFTLRYLVSFVSFGFLSFKLPARLLDSGIAAPVFYISWGVVVGISLFVKFSIILSLFICVFHLILSSLYHNDFKVRLLLMAICRNSLLTVYVTNLIKPIFNYFEKINLDILLFPGTEYWQWLIKSNPDFLILGYFLVISASLCYVFYAELFQYFRFETLSASEQWTTPKYNQVLQEDFQLSWTRWHFFRRKALALYIDQSEKELKFGSLHEKIRESLLGNSWVNSSIVYFIIPLLVFIYIGENIRDNFENRYLKCMEWSKDYRSEKHCTFWTSGVDFVPKYDSSEGAFFLSFNQKHLLIDKKFSYVDPETQYTIDSSGYALHEIQIYCFGGILLISTLLFNFFYGNFYLGYERYKRKSDERDSRLHENQNTRYLDKFIKLFVQFPFNRISEVLLIIDNQEDSGKNKNTKTLKRKTAHQVSLNTRQKNLRALLDVLQSENLKTLVLADYYDEDGELRKIFNKTINLSSMINREETEISFAEKNGYVKYYNIKPFIYLMCFSPYQSYQKSHSNSLTRSITEYCTLHIFQLYGHNDVESFHEIEHFYSINFNGLSGNIYSTKLNTAADPDSREFLLKLFLHYLMCKGAGNYNQTRRIIAGYTIPLDKLQSVSPNDFSSFETYGTHVLLLQPQILTSAFITNKILPSKFLSENIAHEQDLESFLSLLPYFLKLLKTGFSFNDMEVLIDSIATAPLDWRKLTFSLLSELEERFVNTESGILDFKLNGRLRNEVNYVSRKGVSEASFWTPGLHHILNAPQEFDQNSTDFNTIENYAMLLSLNGGYQVAIKHYNKALRACDLKMGITHQGESFLSAVKAEIVGHYETNVFCQLENIRYKKGDEFTLSWLLARTRIILQLVRCYEKVQKIELAYRLQEHVRLYLGTFLLNANVEHVYDLKYLTDALRSLILLRFNQDWLMHCYELLPLEVSNKIAVTHFATASLVEEVLILQKRGTMAAWFMFSVYSCERDIYFWRLLKPTKEIAEKDKVELLEKSYQSAVLALRCFHKDWKYISSVKVTGAGPRDFLKSGQLLNAMVKLANIIYAGISLRDLYLEVHSDEFEEYLSEQLRQQVNLYTESIVKVYHELGDVNTIHEQTTKDQIDWVEHIFYDTSFTDNSFNVSKVPAVQNHEIIRYISLMLSSIHLFRTINGTERAKQQALRLIESLSVVIESIVWRHQKMRIESNRFNIKNNERLHEFTSFLLTVTLKVSNKILSDEFNSIQRKIDVLNIDPEVTQSAEGLLLKIFELTRLFRNYDFLQLLFTLKKEQKIPFFLTLIETLYPQNPSASESFTLSDIWRLDTDKELSCFKPYADQLCLNGMLKVVDRMLQDNAVRPFPTLKRLSNLALFCQTSSRLFANSSRFELFSIFEEFLNYLEKVQVSKIYSDKSIIERVDGLQKNILLLGITNTDLPHIEEFMSFLSTIDPEKVTFEVVDQLHERLFSINRVLKRYLLQEIKSFSARFAETSFSLNELISRGHEMISLTQEYNNDNYLSYSHIGYICFLIGKTLDCLSLILVSNRTNFLKEAEYFYNNAVVYLQVVVAIDVKSNDISFLEGDLSEWDLMLSKISQVKQWNSFSYLGAMKISQFRRDIMLTKLRQSSLQISQ